MNKYIFTVSFFVFSLVGIASCSADESIKSQKLTYGMVGIGFAEIFNGAIGHRRFFTERDGIDVAIEGFYTPIAKNFCAYGFGGNLHYIRRPSLYSPWYYGGGAMVRYIHLLEMKGVDVGPNLLVGREFCLNNGHRSFIQLDAGGFGSIKSFVPDIKLSIGYGF